MITIVYACDDVYVRQTLVSMVSVIKHNSGAKLYLIIDGMSQTNQELIEQTVGRYGQTIHFIDIEDVLPQLCLAEGDRHPKTIYAKLFLENAVKEERVLYLDSDVVVEGSLEPLFLRNMDSELVAGVLMPYSVKVKERVGTRQGEPYICDGVVLFNMSLWKQMKKTEKCRCYIEKCDGRPPMLSEGTLNHVCMGMVGALEPKYNLMPSMLMYSLKQIRQLFKSDIYYQDEGVMREARELPVMIHFMNELYNRPWFEPCDHPYQVYYRKLALQLFENVEYEFRNISNWTKINKKLYRILPFVCYMSFYKLRHYFEK